MADTFDACLAFTLAEEGGFVNDPADPGGATNKGITLATLRGFTHEPALTADDVREIAPATVQAIYQAEYWNRMRCDAMPPGVDLMVFDHGVNAGPTRSVVLLQKSLGFDPVRQDGACGPRTLAAVANARPADLIPRLYRMQAASYRSFSDFAAFGRGWLARQGRRQKRALALADGADAIQPVV
ncbi:MAG TPA: glycosyl hydrolase 108 family protein [Acetobacteraceae bacterium]